LCCFFVKDDCVRSKFYLAPEEFFECGGSTTAPGRQLRGKRAPSILALLKDVTDVTGAKKFFWRRDIDLFLRAKELETLTNHPKNALKSDDDPPTAPGCLNRNFPARNPDAHVPCY
jgi:hypothetical protein